MRPGICSSPPAESSQKAKPALSAMHEPAGTWVARECVYFVGDATQPRNHIWPKWMSKVLPITATSDQQTVGVAR
jgi:hypothetical protein